MMYSWEEEEEYFWGDSCNERSKSFNEADFDEDDLDRLDPEARNELETLLFAQIHFAAVTTTSDVTTTTTTTTNTACHLGDGDSNVGEERKESGVEESGGENEARESPTVDRPGTDDVIFLDEIPGRDVDPTLPKEKKKKKKKNRKEEEDEKGEEDVGISSKKKKKKNDDSSKSVAEKKRGEEDEIGRKKGGVGTQSEKKKKNEDSSKSVAEKKSPAPAEEMNGQLAASSDSSLRAPISFFEIVKTSNSLEAILATIPDDESWKIDFSDSFTLRRTFRYFAPDVSPLDSVSCHNCGKKGHLSKYCPGPKRFDVCYACGRREHFSGRCDNVVCTRCLGRGHQQFYCRVPIGNGGPCFRCGVTGHFHFVCPELWRQHHMSRGDCEKGEEEDGEEENGEGEEEEDETMDEEREDEPRPSCFNCGRWGHLGHQCENEWFRKNTYPNSPFVVQYDAAVICRPRATPLSCPPNIGGKSSTGRKIQIDSRDDNVKVTLNFEKEAEELRMLQEQKRQLEEERLQEQKRQPKLEKQKKATESRLEREKMEKKRRKVKRKNLMRKVAANELRCEMNGRGVTQLSEPKTFEEQKWYRQKEGLKKRIKRGWIKQGIWREVVVLGDGVNTNRESALEATDEVREVTWELLKTKEEETKSKISTLDKSLQDGAIDDDVIICEDFLGKGVDGESEELRQLRGRREQPEQEQELEQLRDRAKMELKRLERQDGWQQKKLNAYRKGEIIKQAKTELGREMCQQVNNHQREEPMTLEEQIFKEKVEKSKQAMREHWAKKGKLRKALNPQRESKLKAVVKIRKATTALMKAEEKAAKKSISSSTEDGEIREEDATAKKADGKTRKKRRRKKKKGKDESASDAPTPPQRDTLGDTNPSGFAADLLPAMNLLSGDEETADRGKSKENSHYIEANDDRDGRSFVESSRRENQDFEPPASKKERIKAKRTDVSQTGKERKRKSDVSADAHSSIRGTLDDFRQRCDSPSSERSGDSAIKKKKKKKGDDKNLGEVATETKVATEANVASTLTPVSATGRMKKSNRRIELTSIPFQQSTPLQSSPPPLKVTLSRDKLDREVELNPIRGGQSRKKLARNFVINKSREECGYRDEDDFPRDKNRSFR